MRNEQARERYRARVRLSSVVTAALILSGGCSLPQTDRNSYEYEAISLSGDTLRAPLLGDSVRAVYEARLAEARAALDHTPDNADSIVWFGRRTAYLGRYREAIDIFTRGIETHPQDPRFYRHRGHRYITTRNFDLAIADLQAAARLTEGRPDQIEPDGLPNARNIPTSTLQGNIWYHLGLAHFLQHQWARAAEAYRRGMELELTTDMRVAFTNWYYLALSRLGLPETADAVLATVDPGTEVIENSAYLNLILFYRGLLPVDSLISPSADEIENATVGFGVAQWYMINGDTARANAMFESILGRDQWAAFGYIGAEAEVSAAPLSN